MGPLIIAFQGKILAETLDLFCTYSSPPPLFFCFLAQAAFWAPSVSRLVHAADGWKLPRKVRHVTPELPAATRDGELRCSGDSSEVPQAAGLARHRDGNRDRRSRLRWRLVVSINKGAIQTGQRRFTPGVSYPRRGLGHPMPAAFQCCPP